LDSVDISSGSPQGSVLSPILFACFINDLGNHIPNCRFYLYADDLQIYTVDGCGDLNWLVALVNGDLQRIRDWSHDISLILTASKTQPLLISRRIWPEDVSSDVILKGDSVRFSDVVLVLCWVGLLVIPNPVPVTSLRGDSPLYYGIRLRNVLPSVRQVLF
jgi:hypothetical protein